MAETEVKTTNDGLALDVKFVHEQGQKFFPITHRKAIMGLSVNTLTLSQSLEIDVNEADNTITINPVVQAEVTKIYNNITLLEKTIKEEINTQINNLWDRVNNMNYALSARPGGPANTALKLTNPYTFNITGDGSGSVTMDGSKAVTLSINIPKAHNNYAAANTDLGSAISADKLTTARTITLTGAVTGSVSFNGTANVIINTAVNHTHSQYSLTSHNHDSVYSKLNHTHSYAGSTSAGGNANAAVKLVTARKITLSGAVTGNATFNGTADITISTTVNHTHSQYATTSHNHDGTYSKLNHTHSYASSSHNHDSVYSKLSHSHSYLPTGGGTLTGNVNSTARYQQDGLSGCLVYVSSSAPSGNAAGKMLWAW